MSDTHQDHEPTHHQGDIWAWMVTFVVTLGLHVGTIVFAALSLAAIIYALAALLADTTNVIRALAWVFTLISLVVWGLLIKQQVRGFRPHEVVLGQVRVATSGCEWGEIAADLGAALVGLAQIGPLVYTLIGGEAMPERTQVVTALAGGLFVVLGGGTLALRIWLCRRARRNDDRTDAQ